MHGSQKAHLNAIVRRKQQPTAADEAMAPFTADQPRVRQHVGKSCYVESQVHWPPITPDGQLRGPPELRLRWFFHSGCGGTLFGYRRTGGLGLDGDHGNLIIRSGSSGEHIERLEPGEYCYTFCRVHHLLGMARSYSEEVQFTEHVPSAAKVLQMMRDALEYKRLQTQLKTFEPPAAASPEDALAKWTREFEQAVAELDLKAAAATRLAEEWAKKRQEVKDSRLAPHVKRAKLDAIDGIMRKFRENLGYDLK